MVPDLILGVVSRRVLSLLALLSVFMAVFPIIPGTEGQGGTGVAFGSDIEESLEDGDGDGLYEYLVLKVEVRVYEPGTYGLHGSIGNGQVNANFGPADLSIGQHHLELKISGGQLSQYGSGGHYRIMLEIYTSDLSIDPVEKEYLTEGEYDPLNFEVPTGSVGTSVFARGDKVFIQSKDMTVSVNQTYPQLQFYYTDITSSDIAMESSITSLTYRMLIAYDDKDDNGRWDPQIDEKRYEGDLTTVAWELDLDISVGYDIALSGVVQLRLVETATVVAWAKISFRLNSEFLQNDGNLQKFDIDIQLWQPLDVDCIAILHTLEDLSGKQSIEEGGGEESGFTDPFILRLVGDDGKTHGAYTWGEDIRVGELEPDIDTNATTWYDIKDGSCDIWFSYPLQGDVQQIHHDPKVGMDPDNRPGIDDKDNILENNLLIMLGGLMGGVVVVGITVIMGIRRGKPSKGGD
ncbi:MAG: hypothetical protein ACMUIE_05755 [Thermoplasmatota archaeon]